MSVDVRQQGRYELFETTHHHRILSLDRKRWYAWVEGQAGEILVRSDSDHKKARTLSKGRYHFVMFDDDPKFKDMPHLFLEDGGRYRELMVPNGLPNDRDYQKKVVDTGSTLSKRELEQYLEQPAPSGRGEERMSRPKGGAAANVAHYLKGIDFPAGKQAVVNHAKRKKAPKAVLHQLETLPKRQFDNMAKLMHGINEGKSRAGEKLPLENYDRLNVRQVAEHLDELDRNDVQQLLEYERSHKNRKTLREAFQRRL
jgi:hypothetical protein